MKPIQTPPRRPALRLAALLLPLAAPPGPAQTPPLQTPPAPPAAFVPVTDLGTLGGSVSWGYGVNDAGQVAGTSKTPGDRTTHGFFYADGRMTDLGTLGGDRSEAHALNDAGQVTGDSEIAGKTRSHAFLWRQGRMSDLGTSASDDSTGLAINSAGQVAGRVSPGTSVAARACLWADGRMALLEATGQDGSDGVAVDGAGQVAGTLREEGKHDTYKGGARTFFCDRAVLWDGRKATRLETRGTEFSLANALNDAGQVAGAAFLVKDKLLHACVWQEGRRTDLGTLGEQNTLVYAIDKTGRMVGGTNPTGLEENGRTLGDPYQPQHAFCAVGGTLIDLNDLVDPASGWVLAEARAISDTGYVTGTGTHNGQARAFLLKLPSVL